MTDSKSTTDMSDSEFDKSLSTVLRDYLKEKLQSDVYLTRAGKFRYNRLIIPPVIKPALASVIVAYVSLNAQEKQSRMNLRLQLLILFVTVLNAIIFAWPYLSAFFTVTHTQT